MEERTIHVFLMSHKKTGLLVAVSPDMYGLVLHGKTPEDIERKLPAAIRDLLEAQGHTVESVTAAPDERFAKADYGLPPFIASASLGS